MVRWDISLGICEGHDFHRKLEHAFCPENPPHHEYTRDLRDNAVIKKKNK